MSLKAEINFCLKFLKTLDKKKSSVYSPVSLLNVLAMIYVGSDGKTAEDLSKIIGEGKSKAAIIEYFSNFIRRHKLENVDVEGDTCIPLPEKRFKKDESVSKAKSNKVITSGSKGDGDNVDKEVEDDEEETSEEEEDITPSSKVIIANRIFVNEKIELKKDFEELLKEKFNEKVKKIDFNDTTVVEKIINEFVEEITHGMIKEIIHSDDISPSTSVMLINAIYFIGKWENTFTYTFKEKFYFTSTKFREIKFMKIGPLLRFYYNEGEEWKAIGIPYRERRCWMFIILPKKKNNLENLIQKMDAGLFLEATKGTDSGYIQLTMPMFEISESYDLQENLTQLGLNHLFNDSDLSQMLNGSHKIDKAIHKAMIKVDEYGTVASAVSLSTIVPMCAPRNVKTIIVDHPFLYCIVSMGDQALTEILFAGKCC